MTNPFTVSFGAAPSNPIHREKELSIIRDSFSAPIPRSRSYILSGPRGIGKTVAMAHLLEEYRSKDGFLVSRLDIGQDMLAQLAASLYEGGKAKHLFLKAEFSVSFQGFGLSIKGESPASDVRTLVQKILDHLKKKGVRLIVAIDDVAKTEELAAFIRAFQGFLIDGYDVCLLMTGLYENVESLSRVKTLTFLKRAPKVYLGPLPLPDIAIAYARILDIPLVSAALLAKFTEGFAYAYQVLGDILYRNKKTTLDKAVIDEFDQAMREGSYGMIFDELSPQEKRILFLASEGKNTNEQIKEALDVKDNYLSAYKNVLAKKGLIKTSVRGAVVFALPRFNEYVVLQNLVV